MHFLVTKIPKEMMRSSTKALFHLQTYKSHHTIMYFCDKKM